MPVTVTGNGSSRPTNAIRSQQQRSAGRGGGTCAMPVVRGRRGRVVDEKSRVVVATVPDATTGSPGPAPIFRARIAGEEPLNVHQQPKETPGIDRVGEVSIGTYVLVLDRKEDGGDVWLRTTFTDSKKCLLKEGWIKYDPERLVELEPMRTNIDV